MMESFYNWHKSCTAAKRQQVIKLCRGKNVYANRK